MKQIMLNCQCIYETWSMSEKGMLQLILINKTTHFNLPDPDSLYVREMEQKSRYYGFCAFYCETLLKCNLRKLQGRCFWFLQY